MALTPNKIPVQFRGLETKLDPRQAVVGDLVLLENVRFDNPPRLNKRYGSRRLTKASAGRQLATFKREVLVGTGFRLMSYSQNGLVDKGVLESFTISSQPIARNVYTQQMPDSAVHSGGIAVFAWESIEGGSTVSRYTVFDSITRQPVVSNVSLGSTAVKPKVLSLGNYVVILYMDSGSGAIRYISIPANDPTRPSAAVDFASNANKTLQLFDATVCDGKLYLVYLNVSSKIVATYIDEAFQLYLPVTVASGVTPDALTVFTNGEVASPVWFAYAVNGSSIPWRVKYDATLSTRYWNLSGSALGGQTYNICGIGIGETSVVFYEVPQSVSYTPRYQCILYGCYGASGSQTSSGFFSRTVGLASKPFYYGDRVHVLTAHQSDADSPSGTPTGLQNTYFLQSFDPTSIVLGVTDCAGTVVGKIASGIGGGHTQKVGLPEVNQHSTGIYGVAHLQVDRLFSSQGNTFTQTGIENAVFNFNIDQESLEMGDTLLITGGILSMYDGAQVCEHNFHLYPENVTVTKTVVSKTSTTGADAGQYQICVVFEWMDNFGIIQQSAPSPVVSVTVDAAEAAAGAGFTYAIPALALTSKNTPVSVVVYRTKANESVMYRVTPVGSPLLVTGHGMTVGTSEAAADTVISGNPQLVFNPLNSLSEVAPLAMDAPLCLFRYRNRVVVIPSENPGQWMYSKAVVPGVPVEFNPQQFFNPVQGGSTPIVCGIEMDDKVILFASDRIYYTIGDGPAPNGTSNDYGNAYRIPSDVGCANSKSIALTPQGVIFQSAKGLYLLGRDLSVNYIGAPVEKYNDIPITSAWLVPGSRRAVFTLSDSEQVGNIALVFDYYVQKWSVWTRYGAVDACIFNGVYTRLLTDGTVLQETVGEYTDENSQVNIKLKTSWLNFAGLSGYQRVWRFIVAGSYKGKHTLMVSVAYDDNPSAIQNVMVDASLLTLRPNIYGLDDPYGPLPPPTYGEEENTSPVADTQTADIGNPGGGSYPQYEWLVKILQQKSTSIQITITECQPDGAYSEGLELSSMTFLVGEMPKLNRVPARRSI